MLFSELMVASPLTILTDISWTKYRIWKIAFWISVWPLTQKTGKTQYPTHIDNDQLQPLELCVTSSAHKESSHTSIQTPWDLIQNRSSASSRVTTQTSWIMSLVPVIVVEPNWQNYSVKCIYSVFPFPFPFFFPFFSHYKTLLNQSL